MSKTSEVVFVCEHGSGKSLVAAHWLMRLAGERGLQIRAVSRGITPDTAVPPAARAGLGGDGFDVASYQPLALTDADLAAAARVVAFGITLDGTRAAGGRVDRWDEVPPVSVSYPEVRQAIQARVRALLDELERDSTI